MIHNITSDENAGIVSMIPGMMHGLEDGDMVVINKA